MTLTNFHYSRILYIFSGAVMTCVLISLAIKISMLGVCDFRDATLHTILICIACQQLHPYFNKQMNTFFHQIQPIVAINQQSSF